MYKYCFECQNKNKNIFCTQHVLNLYFFGGNLMNNLLSYCGLTDARMRASEKDLSVCMMLRLSKNFKEDFDFAE